MLLFVTAVTVVLVVSFLCSIFESVLLTLTRPQIEVMVREKRRAGFLLAGFKANMDSPIAAILILNTAAHTIGAAVAGASYTNVFSASTLWLFSLLFTLAVLLFTEIIPKTMGVSHARSLATPVAHGIKLLTILFHPLVAISERLSRALRGDAQTPVTSTEEIRLLALLGRSEGVVAPQTAGIIVGATQLRDMHARDLLLPRDQVVFLSATMSRDDVVRRLKSSGHSRFPFSPTQDLNDVSGIVLAKKLLFWLSENDDQQIDWDAVVDSSLIVPESLSVPRLLQTYRRDHRHLAIVVDEYGDVAGIVTLEDVLEEIVGDIRDETDDQADDIKDEADGSIRVRADVDLRRLANRLGVQPDQSANTLSGLVVQSVERVPVVGDSIEWRGYRVIVTRADPQRVHWLKLEKM